MNLRHFSTLQIALFASVAVHAVLLSVRFIDPESFNRVFEDTPMEVILVNAKTNEKPDKARALRKRRSPVVAMPRKGAPPVPCHLRR